jgi:DNA-binding NarL/FixJ family response regulator
VSDDETFVRLQGVAQSSALQTLYIPHERVRYRDLTTFALGLVVILSPGDWRPAVALARSVDTIVLAHHPTDIDARYALSAGAIGYLPLTLADATLTKAIRGIVSGDAGFPRSVLGAWLRDQNRVGAQTAAPMLSGRQREVLERIAHGDTDKEIADRLGIATATVNKHVQRLLERLGVPNRAAAVTHTLLRASR